MLGLFVLYNFFPRLTAGLRGCVYYWQCLTVITVLLVRTLSSCHWCPKKQTPPLNSSRTIMGSAKKIVAVASDQRNTVLGLLSTTRLHFHTSLLYLMAKRASTMTDSAILMLGLWILLLWQTILQRKCLTNICIIEWVFVQFRYRVGLRNLSALESGAICRGLN